MDLNSYSKFPLIVFSITNVGLVTHEGKDLESILKHKTWLVFLLDMIDR